MNGPQEAALKRVCARYKVQFVPQDFAPSFDLPKGYISGWIGKPGEGIYVGVSPQGEVAS